MRPLIGITAKISSDDNIGITTNLGCKNQSWVLVADDYVNVVEEMGGIPVIIPVVEDYKNVMGLIDLLDGIIFSGGNDLNPKYYNEKEEFEYSDLVEDLDELEINLYKTILNDTKMPILGICRGLQLINVVHGGKLYQEMKNGEYTKHISYKDPISKNLLVHNVSIKEDTLLEKIVQEKIFKTNTFHHQSVSVLGEGLKINAMSEDGVVEGFEGTDNRFLLAVQWHPEMLASKKSINDIYSRRIFEYFIKESEGYGLERNNRRMIK